MGRSPQFYATAGIVAIVLLAVGLVAYAFWSDYWQDRNRPTSTALQVGDTEYTLRHFTERLRMFVQQVGGPANESAQPSVAIPAVADQLIQEAIVLRFAPEEGVSAGEEDIKAEIANRLGLTVDDASFDARYQEELTRSGLTDEQYRQMAQAAVLTNKIRTKLEEGVPAAAESVHFRQILVSDDAAAQEIKKQIEDGGDFAQLAAERSLDTATKDEGGDAGWVPRGLLDKAAEDALFGLEPQKVTTFSTGSGGAYVLQLLEKAADREIAPDQKGGLARAAFERWIQEKRQSVKIVNDVDPASGDADKIRWAVGRVYQT